MPRPSKSNRPDYDPDAPREDRGGRAPEDRGPGSDGAYAPQTLVYDPGDGSGAMRGNFGNNFVNMQAYLQANRGTHANQQFYQQGQHAPGEYTPGEKQLDESLNPYFVQNTGAPAGYFDPTGPGGAAHPAGGQEPAPHREPGMGRGGLPPIGDEPKGPGPQNPGSLRHTGMQAESQGFEAPNFMAPAAGGMGGNFGGMNDQLQQRKQQGGLT